MCTKNKIEKLEEKLNNIMKKINREEINKVEILKISQKLDKLILEYYLK